MIPAVLGRGGSLIVDVSVRGVRVRHHHPVRCGQMTRVAFTWQATRFSFKAQVLASRVSSMADGKLTYESRLLFREESEAAGEALRALIERDDRAVNTVVSDRRAAPPASQANLQCAWDGNRWTEQPSSSNESPAEGFVVRRDTRPDEIDALRTMYAKGSDHVRAFLREETAAALRGQPRLFEGDPQAVVRFLRGATAAALQRYASTFSSEASGRPSASE